VCVVVIPAKAGMTTKVAAAAEAPRIAFLGKRGNAILACRPFRVTPISASVHDHE
jgi:hypothetical protein